MIFHILWDQGLLRRGSFEDLVFRLVLFHRSLEGSSLNQNLVNLNKMERINYCDEQLFDLIKILMIADNQAYLLLGYTRQYRETEKIKILS